MMLTLSLSGCIDGDGGNDMSEASATEIVVVEDASGYEYLGSRSMDVSDVSRQYVDVSDADAAEGLYQDANAVDYYIHAIELENSSEAEDFVERYKATFRPLNSGERFTEESFNDHEATRINTYTTSGATQTARYRYVWTSENFVMVVGGNSQDPEDIRTLAEATGY
ncbi:hypothetical protein CUN85_12560 [Methanolobus halotolerans]|uniref:DUF4367 domain-containing protein n=2 Tax=Methanolobus halotolerans TaxID=2052935 RepID=A0A4E0QQ28_9EURY|nr:hypothetical protein CUN85_12560 [Methanolobus halotolerans]